jgi:hypothetical protein
MAMTVAEVKRWLDTLDPANNVAVDDGGLTIVELTPDGKETGAYLELGGVPGSIFGDEE